VDFISALKPLADTGYDGWVIVEAEQDPAKAHPFTYAKRGYANLRRVAEEGRLQDRLVLRISRLRLRR
jgi:inosose dehydratase